MAYVHPAWIEHQRRRFMRPDAQRYWRPDADRLAPKETLKALGWQDPNETKAVSFSGSQPSSEHEDEAAETQRLQTLREIASLRVELAMLRLAAGKANFNPNQPRVPAGNPDGGQWTTEGSAGRNDPRVISDATPDDEWKPGAQYAQRFGRGPIIVQIGNRRVVVEGGQAARFVEAQMRADSSIARVREIDPTWRPTPSAFESVEGLIRARNAEAREAQSRVRELARAGIGPGPFARESIEARSSNIDFTAAERREINRIGRAFGCHTCGTLDPGTRSGNFVPDHQLPSALNPLRRQQHLYPQCRWCSSLQGGSVNRLKLGR